MNWKHFALWICMVPAVSTVCSGAQDSLSTAKSRFARLDRARVHYKSLGKGTDALVFIHGWACDMNFWRAQVPAFAGDARMILIDLPGHGLSDKPPVKYTMAFFARAIEAVLRSAKVNRAVLVGHSMGTPVVRQFYRLYPQKTLALAAVDGALRGYSDNPEQAETFISPLRGADFKSAAAKFVDGMLPPTMPPTLCDEIRKTMLSAPQHVMVGAMEGMLKDMAIWQPDPIKVPLQLLLAANPMWSADYEAFVRKLAPQVDYRVFSGVSHFLMMEQPEPVNRALREFLANNRLLGYK